MHQAPKPLPTRRNTLKRLAALATAACGLDWPAAALAQDRVVRFILPVAPGSGVDAIVRASSAALGKALGHPVVVDNQPGAGGIVGTAALVKALPDGYTLSVVSNNHVIYPSVYKSLPFDPVNDITPVCIMGSTPLVLVANPKLPASNAKELVALLKARPNGYNYGSSGNGTILHLAAELFLDEAGVTAKHIPYKGAGPMLTDLMGGQTDFGVLALPSVQAHLKSGALRAIGIATASRSPAAPEIATFVEQGLPNYLVEGVRRHRPGAPAGQRSPGAACRSQRRLRHARGARSHGQTGQHHQHLDARIRRAILQERAGEVCAAGQEGGGGVAIDLC